MARLAETEFRLRSVAGTTCAKQSAATGVTLDALDAYAESDQEDLRKMFSMGPRPQVAAVAPGSPADRAGVLAGDDLAAINGVPVEELAAQAPNRALLADFLQDHLAATPPGAAVRLSLVRNGSPLDVEVHPERLCAARFVLKTDTAIDAYADDDGLAVTVGLLAFTRNDDELALVAGHELAHIIGRDGKIHQDGGKRSLADRRAMEDRADILGAALAHCAGYDVALSVGFWERFRQRDWLGFLRYPTHSSVKERIRRIRAAVPGLSCPPTAPPLHDASRLPQARADAPGE